MSMDLMYGCVGSSDFDKSLQELIECDLKSSLDNSNTPDLMAELANGPLLTEDGFDEFSIQFDPSHRLFESYGLSFGIMDPNGNSPSTISSATGIIKSINSPVRHHITSVSSYISATSNLHHHNHHFHHSSHHHGGSGSSHGISFDEQYGILVDPSSIVPVSVGSVGSASGSETDPECINTDEEDEPDPNPKTWMNNAKTNNGSLTPSPEARNQEPEFELIEEADFILSEPIVHEGPPPKKRKQKHEPQPHTDGKIYPKPGFSYSCLIAMSLKNSKTGSLPVSEIYKFMCDHFPYFKSAPSGWKNSVRHNLSLNKCFEKIEKPGNAAKKGCLWALTPAKVHKMDEEVQKWLKKDPQSIIRAMSDPENLELIERGELKRDYSGGNGAASDEEEEELLLSEPVTPQTPSVLGTTAFTPAGRVSRENSTESKSTVTINNSSAPVLVSASTTPSSTTTSSPSAVTMSQLRATLQQASQSHLNKIQIKSSDGISSAQLGALGNVVCHSNGTYTLNFSGLPTTKSTNPAANNNTPTTTTPIIIRRSPPVK